MLNNALRPELPLVPTVLPTARPPPTAACAAATVATARELHQHGRSCAVVTHSAQPCVASPVECRLLQQLSAHVSNSATQSRTQPQSTQRQQSFSCGNAPSTVSAASAAARAWQRGASARWRFKDEHEVTHGCIMVTMLSTATQMRVLRASMWLLCSLRTVSGVVCV